jgi:phage antirepressor YoqD-like protein
VAKTLALRDSQKKLIGRNRMFRCLRYNKILDKKNAPYQFYLNMDLAKYHSVNKRYLTPLFSEAGIDYLNQRFINGKFIVNVDYVKRVTERKKVLRTLDEVC